jgi:membrane protein
VKVRVLLSKKRNQVEANGRHAWYLVRITVNAWLENYAPSMGAALAFYTMFSMAPMLLIIIAVAGYFFGADAARGEVVSQLAGIVGERGAHAMDELIISASASSHRLVAAGIGIFLIGATSVFNELQNALNRIWRAPRAPRAAGFLDLLRARLISFAMVFSTSFLLVVVLLASATVSALQKYWVPGSLESGLALLFLNVLTSFSLITVVFALIYKVVPRHKVRWHDVWIGAAITASLFEVGKLVIGVYLQRSSIRFAFGGIGSFAVFLLWVYYSAQVFLLGAQFTFVYACTRKSGRMPGAPARPRELQAPKSRAG